ncbi:retrovirus-related pol polyprotein from transposon TNT 1-94 [Tanacetum coccineum]
MDDSAWIESMQEELHQFDRLDVWELVDRPLCKNVINLKWLCKNKRDEENNVIHNKSRLVAKGYAQRKELISKSHLHQLLGWKLSGCSLRFSKGSIDPTLFITKHGEDILLVQIYVDDIIFGSTNLKLSKRFEKLMHNKFDMSMMGELKFFLGIQIHQSPRGIFINQAKYAQEILKKHASRLDIVHATCYCARYQAKPTEKYLTAVKRIFWYLKDSINMGLWYPKDTSFELNAFSDLDHAGCLDSRKSTSGGKQFIGSDKLVSWSFKKQDCTSMSSAEAEYVSLSACCAQVLWLRTQLTDYGFHFDKNNRLYCTQRQQSIS